MSSALLQMLIMACHKHVMQTRKVSLGVDLNPDWESFCHTAVPRTCVPPKYRVSTAYLYLLNLLIKVVLNLGAAQLVQLY